MPVSHLQVSEGLDFADHAGRAVIITGMPFASRNDPKVCSSTSHLVVNQLSQYVLFTQN